jgi:hypothetical protein
MRFRVEIEAGTDNFNIRFLQGNLLLFVACFGPGLNSNHARGNVMQRKSTTSALFRRFRNGATSPALPDCANALIHVEFSTRSFQLPD